MAVNFKFLMELEGFCTEGYVPMRGSCILGNSGVTIASGFDIGQRDERELRSMGLDSFLVERLLPYAGKTKGAALGKLARCPLVISVDEAIAINTAVKKKLIPLIAQKYTRASGVEFDSLPDGIQTVVASVLFQYGIGSPEKTIPNFWKQVTEQRWDDAVANLRNFGDAYKTRRNKEAILLENSING